MPRRPGRRVGASIAASGLTLLVASPALATPCAFSKQSASFAGSATEQALCLLRPVARWGRLGSALAVLPPTLRRLVGTAPTISRADLARRAAMAGLDPVYLDRPVSRARGERGSAAIARYFVIHDTSSPWFGDRPFPTPLDSDPRVNDNSRFLGPKAVAHAFVDRTGRILIGHDFGVPWRATKREARLGSAAKGLFLHIENVQPRRRDPRSGPRNDAIAPEPGLSLAQYDSLALLYVVASARAGTWLVPAYHAALDDGLRDAHDDPQNFDLGSFDAALGRLVAEVEPQRP